jgi:sigma-54 dependent transcriptional regulator, acetoin dehydrogenase operon transcriptional activator AcoR
MTSVAPRTEIAASWHRAAMCGLPQNAQFGMVPVDDIDRSTRLLMAAGPVLDRMAEELLGSRFAILLADRSARLVDQRFGVRRLRGSMENAGANLGRRWIEETTGTNAVATVFETRRGIAVRGDEHYVESLRPFSCYGHPVIDHATDRLAGILDITCPEADDNPLLAPFLVRAAREIEHRLLDSARASEQRLLAAFRLVSARRGRAAVVALGNDLVLANDVARRTLDPVDHVVLAGLAEQASNSRDMSRRLQLSSGRAVQVRWRRLDERAGVVFEIRPGTSAVHIQAAPLPSGPSLSLDERAQHREPILVSGEPGTGRTSTANRMLGGGDPRKFDAAGRPVTAAELIEALAGPRDVVIESVHRLTPAIARQLAEAIDSAAARVVLTCGPAAELHDEHQTLAARCATRVELPPLRNRLADIPELVADMLGELPGGPGIRFTVEALEILARQPWPGNLTELRTVVAAALQRATGDIAPGDLPIRGRRGSTRSLTLIERAECSAIQHALRVCDDNKRAAARLLSMSPTTLYRRMRAFGLAA